MSVHQYVLTSMIMTCVQIGLFTTLGLGVRFVMRRRMKKAQEMVVREFSTMEVVRAIVCCPNCQTKFSLEQDYSVAAVVENGLPVVRG